MTAGVRYAVAQRGIMDELSTHPHEHLDGLLIATALTSRHLVHDSHAAKRAPSRHQPK